MLGSDDDNDNDNVDDDTKETPPFYKEEKQSLTLIVQSVESIYFH